MSDLSLSITVCVLVCEALEINNLTYAKEHAARYMDDMAQLDSHDIFYTAVQRLLDISH